MTPRAPASELDETRDAFDSVAADYDGPRGNNVLIQDMRQEMWRLLDATFPAAGRLLDLGCGTGLDATRMALRGHHVTATDWSPLMVQRTVDRVARAGLSDQVRTLAVGAHELACLPGAGTFDGAYSNLGPLNCVPDLAAVAREAGRLLKPGGTLVFSVIGRVCPWEMLHYARRRNWARASVRFSSGVVPIGMNGHTIWTRYYTPREFYGPFRPHFALAGYRALCLFAPPPYLTSVREMHPRLYETLWRVDRRVAGWPLFRAMGDHFVIMMKKKPRQP